ncbi:transglycosylase SLT domain-containing protein [Actibacterium sp. D379-3]
MKKTVCAVMLLLLPLGCGSRDDTLVSMGTSSNAVLPAMRWDDHRPADQAARWTRASLLALETYGAGLARTVPADIADYCPGYPDASLQERRAFWAGLFSALAKHESTWNPQAVGGGGQWFGLVQIAPATARGYGCSAQSGAALKDGAANLSCAIRIAARTVARDQVVSAGGHGIAADWGPFHSADKRADIAAWTGAQSYCRVE